MPKSNFERMIEMASEVFDARNDPHQLDVDQEVIAQLLKLHPATVSEYNEGKGPAVWILLIPVTNKLMQQFLQGEIGETELLNQTPVGTNFECIYLCSAMVLPEYRGKGIAKKLTLKAIESVRKTNSIKTLFVWPFSKEGKSLAENVAKTAGLSLEIKKQENIKH